MSYNFLNCFKWIKRLYLNMYLYISIFTKTMKVMHIYKYPVAKSHITSKWLHRDTDNIFYLLLNKTDMMFENFLYTFFKSSSILTYVMFPLLALYSDSQEVYYFLKKRTTLFINVLIRSRMLLIRESYVIKI